MNLYIYIVKKRLFVSTFWRMKQEHQGVNNIFSHFLYLIFFRRIRIIWKHNNKNQVEKFLSPPGFEPGTSDTGLKTKKAIFRKRGPLFRPEVIDRFCWFSIANIGRQQSFLSINLERIEAKLRPWECRIRKHIKWPLWRHRINIFKIWEKCHLKILLRSCGPSFIKIGRIVFK